MIMALMATTLVLAPPPTYEEIETEAINNCHTRRWYDVDTDIVKDLVTIEKRFFETHDIPKELRGMLLAAACNESGYNPRAQGDWTRRRGRRVPMAKGIVQLHPWWTKKYKVDRFNHVESANAWMTHVVRQREKIDDRHWCKRHTNIKKWVVAWVQTTRGRVNKENRYRCYQSPSHYRHLKRWYRSIKESRRLDDNS